MVLILSFGLLPNVNDGNLRNPLDGLSEVMVGEPGGVAAFSFRRKRLDNILELVFLVGDASTLLCDSDVGPCGVDGRACGCCTCSLVKFVGREKRLLASIWSIVPGRFVSLGNLSSVAGPDPSANGDTSVKRTLLDCAKGEEGVGVGEGEEGALFVLYSAFAGTSTLRVRGRNDDDTSGNEGAVCILLIGEDFIGEVGGD